MLIPQSFIACLLSAVILNEGQPKLFDNCQMLVLQFVFVAEDSKDISKDVTPIIYLLNNNFFRKSFSCFFICHSHNIIPGSYIG